MVVKRLTEATERYGAGQVTAAQMENRMERDLLFLDDLVSKRRWSQLNRLQQEVKRERAALQKLVERIERRLMMRGSRSRSSPRSFHQETP